jgi:hypothetical protein
MKIRSTTRRGFVTALLLLFGRNPSLAFCPDARLLPSSIPRPPSKTSTTVLQMIDFPIGSDSMDFVDAFFRKQPYFAAFMACCLKASTVDLLAQTSTSKDEKDSTATAVASTENPLSAKIAESPWLSVNLHRTFAFYLYGGMYQGMFLQLLYSMVYPWLYGNSPHCGNMHNPRKDDRQSVQSC